MNLEDLCDGVLPRSLHYRIERLQVAEFYELGVKVCSYLHGHGENRGTTTERQAALDGRWWLAGYRPWFTVEQLDLGLAS